jgi:paraquat-inducible protein B
MIHAYASIHPLEAPKPWAVQPSLTVLPSSTPTPSTLAEKLRHAHDDLQKTLKQLETAISHRQQRLYVNRLHVQLHTLDGLLKEAIDLLSSYDRRRTDQPKPSPAANSLPDSTLNEIRSLFVAITEAIDRVEPWNRT